MDPSRNFKFHGLESGKLTGVAEKPKKIGGSNDQFIPSPASQTAAGKEPIQYKPASNPAGPVNPQAMAEIMKMFGQITSDIGAVKNHIITISNGITSDPDAIDETLGRCYHFVDGYVIVEDRKMNVYQVAGYQFQDFPMSEFDIDDVMDWIEENQPELDNSGDELAARAIECKTEDLLTQLDDLLAVAGSYGLDDNVFDEFKHAVNNMCTFREVGAGTSGAESDEDLDEPEGENGVPGERLEKEVDDESSENPDGDQKKRTDVAGGEVNVDDLPDIDGSNEAGSSNLQNYTREINDRVPDSAVENLVAGTNRANYRDRRLQQEYRPDLVGNVVNSNGDNKPN